MNTARSSTATVLIIALLTANLGLSAYIAFRPSPISVDASPKEVATSDITTGQARKLSEALIPLYNQKKFDALYEQFDLLAKVQFSKEQLATQIDKLHSMLGQIDGCAYSHATVAGTQGGRTFYTLHYKVSLSGGQLSNGDLTLTVTRNAEGFGLFGFFINGNTGGGRP